MYYVKKELIGGSLRPIIELDLFPGCLALIDTGAAIPVWAGEESRLAELENVRAMGKHGEFGGFGGSCRGNLYEITMDFGELHYISMPIVASRMKESWHMVLPATMFDGMRYTIDNVQRTIVFEVLDNQPVRHLKYRNEDGKLYILSQETLRKRSA